MAAVVTMLMAACVEEKHEPGAPDRPDCAGVYFVEEQENVKVHTLEQGKDETYLEFIVRRKDVSEEEYISFESEVYYITKEAQSDTSYREVPVRADELFEFGELYFKEGEKETKIKVWFDRIELGEKYTCSIHITDPEYVSAYAATASSITFSVQMFSWKNAGTAIVRDALFSDMFLWEGRYLENTQVKIQERTDANGKNFFRLVDLYSPSYIARLVEGDEAYEEDPEDLETTYSKYIEPDTYIYVDARDSSKVYIPAQKTGFSDPSLGDIMIASDVPEVWGANSNLLYGNRSEDGVITFPKKGLLISLGAYYYFSNTSGKFRLVLPGGKAEDYGLELENEEVDAEGKIKVTFKPAKDVKKIKYAMFRGKVSEIDMSRTAEKVHNDTDNISKTENEVNGEFTLDITPSGSNPETDIYTLVACTYGADGQYREHASREVGYVNPADAGKKDVQISFGMTVDDRFASEKEKEDYNSTNSFQYWVRGKDITHAMFNYYTTSYYNTYKEQIEEELRNYGSINSLSLKMLNKGELSGIVGNTLKPGTSYTFVVYAENGYYSIFDWDEVKTTGEEDLVQKSYYFNDFIDSSSVKEEDFTSDKWIPVSIDIFDDEAEGRSIRGIGENDNAADTVTFVKDGEKIMAKGLFPSLKKDEPAVAFNFKDGKLWTCENEFDDITIKDSTHLIPNMKEFKYTYTPKFCSLSQSGYVYNSYDTDEKKENFDMMAAGFVNEDIIAFADNKTEHMFWSIVLGGYVKDSDGEDVLSNIIGDTHGDLILVRAGSPLLENLVTIQSSKPMKKGQVLNSVNEANCVAMPDITSVVRTIKKFDIAHEAIRFEAEKSESRKDPIKNGELLEMAEDAQIRTIIR